MMIPRFGPLSYSSRRVMSNHKTSQRSVTLFAGLLALLCFVGIASVFVKWQNQKDEGGVSWLYSQTADNAELDNLGGGKYRMTLRGVDYHTIQFSDRPDRLVKIMDTADFVTAWDRMFASSLPNAVLIEHEPSGTTDSLVVVLNKPTFNYASDELVYEMTITADEDQPERLRKMANAHDEAPMNMRAVSLFIDSVTSVGTNSSPVFTGPAADALKSKLGLPSIPTQPVSLGGGVTINSATVSYDTNGGVTANATVGFGNDSFTLNMTVSVTDSKNWSLTAAASSSNVVWKPAGIPGLAIDPSTFSGSITSTNGSIAYSLTASQQSWTIADGATLVSTPTFSSSCPLADKCPTGVTGPYLTMNGSLTFPGQSKAIAVTGGINATAEWIRFDGVAGNVTYSDISVTAPTLTIWHGQRADSYNADMSLPSLQKLSGGVDIELCGGFTLSIPKIANKSTSGCVRWSPKGVVIGQVGIGATLSGSLSSTGTSASASTDIKGAVFTNLTNVSLDSLPSKETVMNGVSAAIESKTIVIAGKASLPGVVTKALGMTDSSLSVDVTGSLNIKSITLNGVINTNIKIGSEPFKVNIQSLNLGVSVQKGNGASFSISSRGTATVGYAPNTREVGTFTVLAAATAPESGMSLSVTAQGIGAPGETNDGLTAATALKNPAGASFVWPDQFGIKGLNLWNLTVQISYAKGSPALGYTSTSYMDPNGAQTKNVIKCANSTCTSSDWMVGTLGFNISYTSPCFAYQFDSAGGTSGFAIDGGAMKATKFAVGIAPTGCQIQSGSQQLELPAAFAGFQFTANFGDASVSVATKVSDSGFYFDTTISNLKLAGISYSLVNFHVEVNESSSEVSFTADMTSGMGDMDVSADFTVDGSGMSQTLEADLTNWGWQKNGKKKLGKIKIDTGSVDLTKFHFKTSSNVDGTCASFSSDADGTLKLGSSTYTLEGASFSFDCNGVNKLYLKISYDHVSSWNNATVTSTFELNYPYNGKQVLYGAAGFSYTRHFSDKYKDRTFSKDVSVSINMSLTLDTKDPGSSSLAFSGSFDADRVSGDISCDATNGWGDFTCSGELRLNPSWAGVYHSNWDGL